MDWRTLLEPLLPGVLQFLESAFQNRAAKKAPGAEILTGAVELAQHALSIAGVPLPSSQEVESMVQSTMNKMKTEVKLGDFRESQQVIFQPRVGEPIQPS